MSNTDGNLVKVREDTVVWRQVGDEIMILDTGSSEYLSVNKTGAVIWPLLVEGSTMPHLVQALVAEFGVDQVTAELDAQTFVSSLDELGLLVVPEGDPG